MTDRATLIEHLLARAFAIQHTAAEETVRLLSEAASALAREEAAAPAFTEGNSQQGCFTAADLEAACRVGFEMAANKMNPIIRIIISRLEPPTDLAKRVKEARKCPAPRSRRRKGDD